MLKHLKASLRAPSFETEEQTYAAAVANTISLTLLSAAAVLLAAYLARGDWSVVLTLAVVATVLLSASVTLRRGHLLPVSTVIPLIVLLFVTYHTYHGNGLHDIAVSGYPLVLVLAGFLLGKSAPIGFALASIGCLAGIYWVEMSGRLVTPWSTETDLVDLVTLSAALVVTAVLVRMLIGHLTASLERSRLQERALAASHQELEDRNAELERFTYTVSHDLRSPLITIRGFLGFVEKNAVRCDVEMVRADVARIREATDKMDRLLTDLLELSRIGRVIREPEKIDFAELAREAVGLTTAAIEERGVEVTIAPGVPALHGDRPRLLQVLQNLIENAVKFMGDEEHPRIEIGAETDGDGTSYYVRDNGMGIDARFHEKVFGLFERLDPGVEGTGVGLAIVRRIVELHGGRITVDSEGAGRGSTFSFTVPGPV